MMFYIIIIFSLVFFIHASIRYTRNGRLIDKIPGPTPYPLIGNLIEVNGTPEEIWNFFRSNAIKFRPIAKAWLGPSALIVTDDPDDVKVALSSKSNITKGFFYKHLSMFLKDGIITSTGNKWRERRKLLNKFFNTNNLKQNMKIMNEQILKMVEQIKSEDCEIQSLIPRLKKLTLNIICASALNINLDDIKDEKVNKYRDALDKFLEFVLYRLVRPYLTDWILKFSRIGYKQKRNVKILHDFSNKIIQERRKYHQDNGYKFFQNEKQNRLNILDFLLLAEKDGLIDEQGVQDEINTIISAGYDTTAVALAYALMSLAENKEIQDLARSEVFEVLNESEGKITDAEIRKLKYVERCVKESLRLFPSAPHIARHITEEMQLKNYTIPTGHDFCIDIFDLHRDPELWENPNKFEPNRFLPQNSIGRHPYSYIPFSAGPRNCIGQNFAIAEMVIIIAHILHNFELEPMANTEDLKFKVHVILATTHPVYVKFKKLNGS